MEELGGGQRVGIYPPGGQGSMTPNAPWTGVGRLEPPWGYHEVVDHEGFIHDKMLSPTPVPTEEYWGEYWGPNIIHAPKPEEWPPESQWPTHY